MPELAEVVFHASKWRAAIGQRFTLDQVNGAARCCRTLDTKLAKELLAKSTLEGAWTHGKLMLFGFENGTYLEAHLGMTGSLRVAELSEDFDRHDHFRLRGESAMLVFRDPRQFGRLTLHRTDGDLPEFWKALPPQPHDATFTKDRFDGILGRRGKAPLKSLLLQQDAFPGIGNWMADEILWRSRIRPTRTAAELSDDERNKLFEACRWVCREAVRIIGADYSDPPKSWLFQHRWSDGGTCPQTGKPLVRDEVGGRTTCWSPAWQR